MSNVKSLRTEEDIVLRYRELKHDLATAEGAQQFWAELLGQEPVKDLLKEFDETIQRCRVGLEEAKSEEIKTLQADIRSRKQLIEKIHLRAAMTEVLSLRRRVAEYREQNALLLAEEA